MMVAKKDWGLHNKMLKIDRATFMAIRGKFARICIEIDLTQPPISKFRLKRRVNRVEYEGLHLVCFWCSTYGHHSEICPYDPIKEKEGDEENKEEGEEIVLP